MKKYIYNFFYGLDVFLAAILLFWVGDAGMTISGKLGKFFPNSLFRKLVDNLFYYTDPDHDHCEDAAEAEQK